MKKFLNKKITIETSVGEVLLLSAIISMIVWVFVMVCWCDSDLLKAITAIAEKGVMLNVMFYLLPIFIIIGVAIGLIVSIIRSEKKNKK